MLGYGEGEIGSDPDEWLGRIHPEDRDHIKVKIDAHVYNHEDHFECECRMRHKDGTYLWMLSRALQSGMNRQGNPHGRVPNRHNGTKGCRGTAPS